MKELASVVSRTVNFRGVPTKRKPALKSEIFNYDRISIKFHMYAEHKRLKLIVLFNCTIS